MQPTALSAAADAERLTSTAMQRDDVISIVGCSAAPILSLVFLLLILAQKYGHTAEENCHFLIRQAPSHRVRGTAVPLVVTRSDVTEPKIQRRPARFATLVPKLSLQRGAICREEMGNGLRFRDNRNEDHKPKTKKENHIMKNRKTILTYIAAAVVTLVVSASSSWGTQPLQGPENYTGSLTHGEFVSCEGQILNPPAYAVDGTWVLHIERMTEPQVPPPANLTMVVFRDGHRYLVFPHIELTPVSLEDGIYTYTWGLQVTPTLDTNTTPATFAWHVVFDDNCTERRYGTLTYFGLANN